MSVSDGFSIEDFYRAENRVFVGRGRELRRLKAAVKDAVSGRGVLMLLSGEAGIGKTRIAEEISGYCRSRGVRPLWSRIHEERGAPQLRPWAQLLRSYIRESDPESLPEAFGSRAGVIAGLVPEVREKLGEVSEPPPLGDPDAEMFRLFESIVEFLRSASEREPLLVVLDNLQWADIPSLELLEFMFREIPSRRIIVLGTCRPEAFAKDHPVAVMLGGIEHERYSGRIELKGLGRKAVLEYLERTLRTTGPETLADLVHERTEGNPLFVIETVRELFESDTLDSAAAGRKFPRLPPGVRDVIGRRLARFSERCNGVLAVAAVVGREFTVEKVLAVSPDESKNEVLDLLEEPLAGKIVEEVPGVPGSYRFTHKYVQDTVKERLSRTGRVRLNRDAGEGLERWYGTAADDHAEELAIHYEEAGIPEKLVRYSRIAGEESMKFGAFEHAQELFLKALETWGDRPMYDETADILLHLCITRFYFCQFDEKAKGALKAFEYFESAGNTEKARRAADEIRFGYACRDSVSPETLKEVTLHALGMPVEAGREDTWAMRKLAEIPLLATGDHDAYEREMERILEIEKRQGGMDEGMFLYFWGNREDQNGYTASALKHFKRAEALTGSIELPVNRMRLYGEISGCLELLGRPKEGLEYHGKLLRLAEEVRFPDWIAAAVVSEMRFAFLTGDWQGARDLNDEIDRISRRHLRKRPDPYLSLCQLAIIEYENGNPMAGEDYLDRIISGYGDPRVAPILDLYILGHKLFPRISRICGEEMHLDLAESAALRLLSRRSFTEGAGIETEILGLVAVLRNDAPAAAKRYRTLMKYRAELIGIHAYSLGLMARTAGDLESAVARFEEAYAFDKGAGYLPELAWVCYDYGSTLLERAGEGDAERARALLDEGHALSTDLEMKPLRRRIAELLPARRRDSAASYPGGLTPREVEILKSIARGMTNQEIGYELSISPRTVATHIRHIFEKTGMTSRTACAAYAIQSGLGAPPGKPIRS